MSQQQYEQQGARRQWAAPEPPELEQSEVVGYGCPYCGTVYSTERSQCDGSDISCCGEKGHCEPYTRAMEDSDGNE